MFGSRDELRSFIASEVVDTSEAMEMLGCSRQNINDLVRRGKLVPIKVFAKTRIFLKSDILARIK